MNKLLNDLLPYLDYSSFSYNPMVGKEKTCLDLYYNHKMRVGKIGVDNDKLYLNILTDLTESTEDSFPRYYNDLSKFLNRFNLKPVMRFSEWDDEYIQVYEILSVNQTLVTFIDILSECLNDRTTASVHVYSDTIRMILDEFG